MQDLSALGMKCYRLTVINTDWKTDADEKGEI